MVNHPHLIIGVDTGGTFTDLVAWDGRSFRTAKVPSTPPDFHRGVFQAVLSILTDGETADIIHGSTVATNALLERKGCPFAFITTEGFRDLLLIGRQNRPNLYALEPQRPVPLVLAENVFTVPERIDAHGRVLRRLDDESIDAIVAEMKARGLKHAAVCLLFSFINPRHEQLIGEACRRAGITVTLSSELLPEFREYERGSATAINAALRPNVENYLARIAQEMPPAMRSLRVMHSGGGTLPPDDAGRFAARLLLSGPAGGVLGASHVAKREGFSQIITYDMGGTSTDVAAIVDGKPPWTTASIVAGFPVPLAMFDIHTIGAGGGSIAALDPGGALQVGPQSAGAHPGPVCYGRGGSLPTVTDANLVLGRLMPDRFLGGRMPLYRELAKAALAPLAQQMNKSPVETALGIVRIAEANMAAAIRHVTVDRGHDPRTFTLVSFGGAGGLHAAALAETLEIPRVLVPPHPGLLSALGMVVAPPVADVSKTIAHMGSALDDVRLRKEYEALAERSAVLFACGASDRLETFADCRFRGQSYELTLPVTEISLRAIEIVFRKAYASEYGHCPEGDREMEIMTLRLRRIGAAPAVDISGPRPIPSLAAQTQIVLPNGRFVSVAVLDRAALMGGKAIAGPALLADPDATAFIPPRWIARGTPSGGVLLERSPRPRT